MREWVNEIGNIGGIKMYKGFDLSAFNMWKCRRCGLVFDEEWVASLHKSVTNHVPSLVGYES